MCNKLTTAFVYAAPQLYSCTLLLHAHGLLFHACWPATHYPHVPSQPHIATTFLLQSHPLEHTFSNALLRHPINAVYNASDNFSHCQVPHLSQRSYSRATLSSFTGWRHVKYGSFTVSKSMESCEITGPLRTSERTILGCKDLGKGL